MIFLIKFVNEKESLTLFDIDCYPKNYGNGCGWFPEINSVPILKNLLYVVTSYHIGEKEQFISFCDKIDNLRETLNTEFQKSRIKTINNIYPSLQQISDFCRKFEKENIKPLLEEFCETYGFKLVYD